MYSACEGENEEKVCLFNVYVIVTLSLSLSLSITCSHAL